MQLPAYQADDDADDEEREPVCFTPMPGDTVWRPVDQWTEREWHHWLVQHDGWTLPRIKQYLEIDRYRYGVGFQRHPKEPFTFFYMPVPAAVPLHQTKTPNICYGGAVGGTKSHSSRWDAYAHLLAIPNYNSLIMRRTHVELEQNHTLKAIAECQRINDFFDRKVMDLTPSQHRLTVTTTNAILNFGHCQNPGDEERYLGPEYDDFRPEELATFEKSQVIGIQGRLRSAKTGPDWNVQARLIATTNPGGAHTQWIREYFIDKSVTKAENALYDPHDYAFIAASLYDNPYLMDPDGTYTRYVKRLFMFGAQRRKQLLNGDWNAITGQFFAEWDPQLHVGLLGIPEGCKIERWIDWGYDPNPGVCHWVACLPNGRLYVFAEWVFNGTGRPKMVAAKVAARIKELTETHILPATRGTISKSVGDPSMWAKDGHIGESYEETFRRHGVRMVQADNDRVMGWGRFRHWLQRHPEGGAWLMYHPDCTYAIRTIPALVCDENNPDDIDTNGEDHAGDADRYGLMSRPTPTKYVHRPLPSIPGTIRHLLDAEHARRVIRAFGQVQ